MTLNENQRWLLSALRQHDSIITDSHLVLTSGKHSDGYINLRVIASQTKALLKIGEMMAAAIKLHEEMLAIHHFVDARPIVIVGPETLGRTLAEFTAAHLGLSNYLAWCDMKKDNNHEWAEWNQKLNFPEIIQGTRCYIVDDLLTTGKSIKLTEQLIKETGGEVVGVLTVVRRDAKVTAETLDIPWLNPLLEFESLLQSGKFNVYDPDGCELCKDRVPMRLRPGHGHEWTKDHPDYPTCDR